MDQKFFKKELCDLSLCSGDNTHHVIIIIIIKIIIIVIIIINNQEFHMYTNHNFLCFTLEAKKCRSI